MVITLAMMQRLFPRWTLASREQGFYTQEQTPLILYGQLYLSTDFFCVHAM